MIRLMLCKSRAIRIPNVPHRCHRANTTYSTVDYTRYTVPGTVYVTKRYICSRRSSELYMYCTTVDADGDGMGI